MFAAMLLSEEWRRGKLSKWLEGHGCEVREIKPSPAAGWLSPPRYVVGFVDDDGVVYDGVFEVRQSGILPVTFTTISGTPKQNRPSFWLRKQDFS